MTSMRYLFNTLLRAYINEMYLSSCRTSFEENYNAECITPSCMSLTRFCLGRFFTNDNANEE